MSKNTYRVIAIIRANGKRVVCYEGDHACLATDTYEELTKRRQTFYADFKVVLERLDPVIVMESD
ncbi:hypothetical protein FDI94_gp57 [Salmonella phage FSL SP-126]|uniref:Uncharacterized protein n=1 Tax=Salmonella phage FSL SP-126 TaxID=2928681 RepID=S4TT05_9CAUD|nr:hypothetical protein FDI94_gp57 [Salmonella phage FSL SP-126]AGF87887.1 hypothetical protein SP126_00285 [Salmonella phage FSL SP-126]